jgi:hypothetical protein
MENVLQHKYAKRGIEIVMTMGDYPLESSRRGEEALPATSR